MSATLKQQWLSNTRGDILSGLVVALALIPEAIAFSIIAGVDPKVGLYASFAIAVTTAIAGGRPAMISAATGAMALLMTDLVKDHGLQYLFAASLLTGVIQIIFGYLRLGSLMRFVSRSVVTGFVNALAILIFAAQLPQLIGPEIRWPVYVITAGALGIIYLLPYVTKAVPSPLVAIIVMTGICMFFGVDINTVGDMGELPESLPTFLIPDIPLNLHSLEIIFPYSLAMAVVGLLESLMTATIIDDFTDTESNKNRECKGQGLANIVSSCFGGMAGCAMIGQSVINVKSGGRTRLSTLIAGIVLLILVVFLDRWVSQIPMAALVAVMIMVSIGTFNWNSLIKIHTFPLSTNIVMVATVIVVVLTDNLAMGVLVGVLLSALFFANKIGQFLYVGSEASDEGKKRTYQVIGQVFFASTTRFNNSFDFKEVLEHVVIDVSKAHFWDITAVGALDKVVLKFRREGTTVEVIGLNQASATLMDRFAVHDKPDQVANLMDH
ncbi:SulP family inorganic anion transporter [Pokkaliibacter sp. CJK22405]|uniref:SulP family inorganic anion transporter n=1 Tax=Pokkaliibacter sp. CJK22405 TaxID=3384615 RepID=UPI0039855093